MDEPTQRAFGAAYGLREYERDRAAGAVVEGEQPATWRECVAALDNGTRVLDESARHWAQGVIAGRSAAQCWTEAHGLVTATTIQAWDAVNSRGTGPGQYASGRT